MTTVKGTLNVDQAVTLDTTLDVTGDTSVSTFDSSGATSLATGSGAVNVASSGEMTTVKGTLNVDEAVTLDTTLDVTGNTAVTGTLSAATGSTIGNLTLANGSITDSSGAISFGDENISTTGTISSGSSTLSSLTVSGATALNGGLSMDTNKFTVADTSGNVATAGTLDVTGASNLSSTLDVMEILQYQPLIQVERHHLQRVVEQLT